MDNINEDVGCSRHGSLGTVIDAPQRQCGLPYLVNENTQLNHFDQLFSNKTPVNILKVYSSNAVLKFDC